LFSIKLDNDKFMRPDISEDFNRKENNMKLAAEILASVALAAAIVTGSATAGLAHGGGGGHGGFGGGHGGFGGGHGGFGGGHFGGMPFFLHGGGFGGSHMNYGDHFGGYSHHYFYHGDRYRPYFPYIDYDDSDDSGYDYYSSFCNRMHPYTGTYIGRDGRLHYCS
jgi:hypothetical protein